MKTKVLIVLNEKEFNIEVGELSAEQKKEFAERFNTEKTKLDVFTAAKEAFEDIRDQYTINAQLLLNAELGVMERVKMLWEQKDLLLQMRPLRSDMEAKGKVPVDFESLAKDQFEILIGGEGKASLVKEMVTVGKSYRTMLNEILPKVAEEKEKK
jgi:hypothetical protein